MFLFKNMFDGSIALIDTIYFQDLKCFKDGNKEYFRIGYWYMVGMMMKDTQVFIRF